MSIKPYELRNGNCKELIKQLADNTVDAIVTDPPYELGFMGKKWDNTGIAYDVELWTECLRVLKPGGHLLAFSGSRTYHRMAVAIEDAGFDIRDQIMWVYGSGFPKSHDVSKAIDKMAGAKREITGTRIVPDQRGGKRNSEATAENGVQSYEVNITAPATDAAKEWNGWGTALKPAHEPICVARKPLIGTVAENVLQYGTGAFNIDACRVGSEQIKQRVGKNPLKSFSKNAVEQNFRPNDYYANDNEIYTSGSASGRWPANLIHDGSAEVLAGFPETANSARPNSLNKEYKRKSIFRNTKIEIHNSQHNDRGSAARFFYCAKASKRDRDEGCGELGGKLRITYLSNQEIAEMKRGNTGYKEDPKKLLMGSRQETRNHHPTVKPTDLMRYLCRLVTPPNGLILDPFTGSGSTGKAAILEGFRFLGFEMEPQYIEIATARIEHAIEQKSKQKTEQENTLFGTNNE